MEKPASKVPWEENEELDAGDDERDISWLERVVRRPDGTFESVTIPLTPKDFLNPKLGDKWAQGLPHGRAVVYFNDILERRLGRDEDTTVLSDVQLLTGPGRRGPAPDAMVVRGARNLDPEIWRFDPVKQGAVPCLVIEVLSQTEALRRADQEDKVRLYQGLGIPDYLLVDPPTALTGNRYQLQGYHMGSEGHYQPIEPDARGRLLCAAVGLLFGISFLGDRIEVFDARTGERLLNSKEEEAGRKAAEKRAEQESEAREAAEERAAQEAEARKVERAARQAAEAELERLRAEIRQLKNSGH